MSVTPAGRLLTEAHRLAQARIAARTTAQMLAAWPLLDPVALDATIGRWLRVAVPLVQAQAKVSVEVAAAYMRQFRMLEVGNLVGFSPVLGELPPVGAVVTSLRVTGPVAMKSATAGGVLLDQTVKVAAARTAGEAARHVLSAGRATVMDTVRADPRARGWARATSGNPCAFCAMLASRGPVFDEDSASFDAHGGGGGTPCQCTAEPVYAGPDRYSWPPGAQEFRAQWDEATEGLSGDDALNAFRRSMTS